MFEFTFIRYMILHVSTLSSFTPASFQQDGYSRLLPVKMEFCLATVFTWWFRFRFLPL